MPELLENWKKFIATRKKDGCQSHSKSSHYDRFLNVSLFIAIKWPTIPIQD
jgi:hypothetical protein